MTGKKRPPEVGLRLRNQQDLPKGGLFVDAAVALVTVRKQLIGLARSETGQSAKLMTDSYLDSPGRNRLGRRRKRQRLFHQADDTARADR